MSKAGLQSAVDALKWYHAIDLPYGITTPGLFPINPEFYKLPEDLTGERVLDVGAWDGYWTFEALKRGAKQVIAIDDLSDAIYPGEVRSLEQFKLCRQALGYTVDQADIRTLSLYMMDDEYHGVDFIDEFDVVLFFGALYHCRHPMLALDKLRSVCKPGALLCVESHISDDYSPYRGMGKGYGEDMILEFFPGSQLAGCPTNWFSPTLKCLANMVEAAGFSQVQAWKIADPGEPTYCRGFVQGVAA